MDNTEKNNANGNSTRALSTRHDAVTGLKVLNLLNDKQLASAEVFLKKIVATEKGGIKNVNEGLAILCVLKICNYLFLVVLNIYT